MQNTQQMIIIAIVLIAGYILYTKYYMKDEKEYMTNKEKEKESVKDKEKEPEKEPEKEKIINTVRTIQPQSAIRTSRISTRPTTPVVKESSQRVQELVENIHRKQL